MYQLFTLFMITDPVTTVSSKKGEMGVTILIAIVEFFLRLAEFIAAPFYALFLVGPAAMLVEAWWTGEKSEDEGPKTEVDRPAAKTDTSVSFFTFRNILASALSLPTQKTDWPPW